MFSNSHSKVIQSEFCKVIQSEFCKAELCYNASKNNHSDAVVFPALVTEFDNGLPSSQQP